jgi:glycerol-3-phosphate dehydrogenase
VNRQGWIDQVFGTGAEGEPFDLAIVGGGATGVGTAVDAASRGFRVLLVEQDDFGKGTSSRSTKLVHGGVRYLQQGNVSLVMEALRSGGSCSGTRRTWCTTRPSSCRTTRGGRRPSTASA